MSALPNEKLYERDFYAWTEEQAALLRAGQYTFADIENIVEEIETMGRGENREMVNRLAVLMMHLLKWEFQPVFQSRSWRSTINEQHRALQVHLKANPSLKLKLDTGIIDAYSAAVHKAVDETGISFQKFPPQCPYTFAQMMDDDFFPLTE